MNPTAVESARDCGCVEDPEWIKATTKLLVTSPTYPLVLLPHRHSSPWMLASWVAYQIALVYPVRSITVMDLVNEGFERKGSEATRFGKQRETGLVIRLGADPNHSYLGPTLAEMIHTRVNHRSPTVLCCERPLIGMTGLYGPGAVAAIQTYPRLCRCPI